MQYTSGTTSRPKAVLWTHANALWGARINAVHEDLQASDVHLVHMPLFHTNAQAYSVLATLWAQGSRHVYLDGGQTVRQGLAEVRVDHLTLPWVPVMPGDGVPLFGGLERRLG